MYMCGIRRFSIVHVWYPATLMSRGQSGRLCCRSLGSVGSIHSRDSLPDAPPNPHFPLFPRILLLTCMDLYDGLTLGSMCVGGYAKQV